MPPALPTGTLQVQREFDGKHNKVPMVTLDHLHSRLGAHRATPADMTGRIQAAVALVLAPGGSGIELLLIRRAEVDGDPWSGQMGLPGGRREDQDADLLATACRETAEETGIEIGSAELIGVLDDIAPTTPILPPIAVRPFVFSLPVTPRVRPSREVADFVWEPLSDIVRSEGETEVTILGAPQIRPAFVLGSNAVWGMTHRILNNLIDITLR
jgi:8-oxo-dGTP pyrophosphatase MutT (NUDIX family)